MNLSVRMKRPFVEGTLSVLEQSHDVAETEGAIRKPSCCRDSQCGVSFCCRDSQCAVCCSKSRLVKTVSVLFVCHLVSQTSSVLFSTAYFKGHIGVETGCPIFR